MKKPSFALWAALLTAIVLIGLCVAEVCREGELVETEDGVVVLRLREWETVELEVRATPAPTFAPLVLPEGAVDVLIDKSRTALTLSSEPEARTVLTDYLQACADGVEEGRVLSAAFDCTVHIVPAAGKTPVKTYAEAMAELQRDAALVPVRMTVEMRTSSIGEDKSEQREEAALEKGEKLYAQLGCGAVTVQTATTTYVAGKPVATTEPVEQTVFDARTTIVRTGTYTVKNAKAEPDSKQGVKGKDADGLKLQLPIRGQVKSYFGIRNNKMHNGIDLPAAAGTAIKAPGEGIVVFVGERAEYGTVIDIDHGNGFVSRLTHCQDVAVEVNQRVFMGDAVATLAPLAYGTGKPHLHYELLIDGIPYNPLYYID